MRHACEGAVDAVDDQRQAEPSEHTFPGAVEGRQRGQQTADGTEPREKVNAGGCQILPTEGQHGVPSVRRGSEAVLDRAAHRQVVLGIGGGCRLADRLALGRAIEQLEAEIHFRQDAELAEPRNADLGAGIGLRRGFVRKPCLGVAGCRFGRSRRSL